MTPVGQIDIVFPGVAVILHMVHKVDVAFFAFGNRTAHKFEGNGNFDNGIFIFFDDAAGHDLILAVFFALGVPGVAVIVALLDLGTLEDGISAAERTAPQTVTGGVCVFLNSDFNCAFVVFLT